MELAGFVLAPPTVSDWLAYPTRNFQLGHLFPTDRAHTGYPPNTFALLGFPVALGSGQQLPSSRLHLLKEAESPEISF